MLAIDYYHKIKDLYHKDVIKSRYIYLYTIDGVVEKNWICLQKTWL